MDIWEYCIIGGGVLGCAIGKTLLENQPNASVLIVEKHANAGQGNTIRSNAAYRNIFDTEINIQLAASSINYYRSQEDLGEDFGRREIGYLFLLTEEQYNNYCHPSLNYNGQLVSFFDFLTIHEISHEIFTANQLNSLFPELVLQPKSEIAELIKAKSIEYGFLGKQCGNFAPDLVVKHYLKLFLDLGGNIQYNTKVKAVKLGSIESDFDPDYVATVWEGKEVKAIEIETQAGSDFILAKNFILATGAWINELLDPLGGRSLVKAKKRQLFTIEDVGEFITNPHFNEDQPVFPFLILPTGGIFIKPLNEAKSVVIGTSDVIGRRFEPTYLPGTTFTELDDPKAERDFYMYNILPVLQSYFPTVFNEHTQIKGTAGHYAYSVDKYPVIDKVESLHNLYFASGASGSGIMKADSIAKICAALVTGHSQAELYGGPRIDVKRFSVKYRDLPDETLVL